MDLITKYRPSKYSEVIGQEVLVTVLADVLEKKTAHAFIFKGPAGTGKTTLARIIAKKVGCLPNNLIEVDAATNTGIDAMRELTSKANYAGLGGNSTRVYIIDEAHRLSANAWDSMLKIIEEPPKHVYWIFCTTNATKIPKTIFTRCVQFETRPVNKAVIFDLLKRVNELEKLGAVEEVLYLLSERSSGSPRQALSYLAQCFACETRKEAAAVLQTVDDEQDVFKLCQLLAKGGSWEQLMGVLTAQNEVEAEGIRIMIANYFSKAAMGSTGEAAAKALNILDAFGTPYPANSGMYPLILSLGKACFAA